MERLLNDTFWRMLALSLIAMVLFFLMLGDMFYTVPPGPRYDDMKAWALCGLLTAITVTLLATARERVWSLYVPAFAVFLCAGAYTCLELQKAGADRYRVDPDREVAFMAELFAWFGKAAPGGAERGWKVGDPLPQAPPRLTARFTTPGGAPYGEDKEGPFYQRYKFDKDIEEIGWRPTPTWTGDSRIILIYTPKPFMRRAWFRPVRQGWAACHGDGQVSRYDSARELEDALRTDAKRRAELGLPPIPFRVYDQ